MSKLPRPLTTDELRAGPALLRALADEWERTDARRTQQALATAIDNGYSATASGANSGPGGGSGTTLTVVEAKATRTDPLVTRTIELLLAQRRILHDAGLAYNRLAEWRGDRPVALCADGHVLDRGSSRCTWVDPETGRQCGTRRETILHCENPSCENEEGTGPVQIGPGQRRWKNPALDLPGRPVLAECGRCRSARRRTGRSWANATRLALPGVGEDGVFVAENAPWPNVG